MKKFLIGLALVVGIMILAFRSAYPTFSWNQKVTVTVNTPNGEASASSVGRMVVSEKVSLGLAEAGGINSDFEGEAVVIALPNERYLFSLISGATSFSLEVFGDVPGVRKEADGSFVQWDESARRIQNLVGAKAFPSEHLPMLVTFDDINDPTSVKEVDPANLAATLGEGYSLKSVTLEITTEAITQGEVVKVLGWLYSHKYRLKSPDLRLGKGPHAASDILPEEELRRSNFIRSPK
ncbi:MAG: hypothetical protein ABJO57_04720 [Lentilitoribacter sp.]